MGFIGHAPLICIVGCLFDSGVYKNSSCHTEKSIFSAPRLLSDHLSTRCRTPTLFNTSCIRFWILAVSPTVTPTARDSAPQGAGKELGRCCVGLGLAGQLAGMGQRGQRVHWGQRGWQLHCPAPSGWVSLGRAQLLPNVSAWSWSLGHGLLSTPLAAGQRSFLRIK